MEELVVCQKPDLIAIADGIRNIQNTSKLYTLKEIAEAVGSNSTIVDGSSLINYNITFSFSSSSVTIVVVYSTWTEEGVKITTSDISTTTTLPILQKTTFTIMGVDGNYPLAYVSVTGGVNDIRSIANGIYYSYVFSCEADGTVHFTY